MMDVQESSLSHHANALQIKHVAYNMQFFLIWILFFCVFNIVIYYALFQKFSYYLSVSNSFIAAILLVGFVVTYHLFHTTKTKLSTLKIWCQILCFIIGIGLGLSSYTVFAYLPAENSAVGPFRLIMLTIVPVSIIYIIAFTYLTQQLQHFILIFIPSALPFILTNVFYPNNLPLFIEIVIIAWLIILFIAAYFSTNLYRRLNSMDRNNAALSQQSHLLAQYAEDLQSKLTEQIKQSDEIRTVLTDNNTFLENKVKDRIHEIKQINDRLAQHQTNLSFTHETAGICSWRWDIKQRLLEISSIPNALDFEYFQVEKPELESIIHPDDLDNYKHLLRLHSR